MKLKSLFQILVNPKGSVNYIEYRAGIIALVMILGVNMQYLILSGEVANRFLLQFFSGKLSGGYSDAFLLVNLITLPSVFLVPARFLLVWGSIVLTYKRFSALGYSKLLGGLLGGLLYLGFASVERLLYISVHAKEASENVLKFSIIVIYALIALALIVVMFSWIRRSKKEALVDYGAHKTPMNVHAYVMKMGKWMLVSAIVLSLIPTLVYAYIVYEKIYISKPMRWGILVCYSAIYLTVVYYYLRYAYFRFKDTGHSVWLWMVVVPVVYLLTLGICVALFHFLDSAAVWLVTATIALAFTVLMMAYPLLLLILPSQTPSHKNTQEPAQNANKEKLTQGNVS